MDTICAEKDAVAWEDGRLIDVDCWVPGVTQCLRDAVALAEVGQFRL